MGLREEKKAQTRKVISDMATRLFVERGYHEVTTAEIARLANVSQPTLFNYFPTKEALVFDDDSQVETELVAAVSHRAKGQSVLEALLAFGLTSIDGLTAEETGKFTEFMALIDSTPELNRYAQQMWVRHERALATAIYEALNNKPSQMECEALARYVLDSFHRCLQSAQPKRALHKLFKIMAQGWRF